MMLNFNSINKSTTMVNNRFQKLTKIQINGSTSRIFVNRPFNKGRLKTLLHWSFSQLGEKKTIDLVERLKHLGYSYATKAGLSLSVEDLLIPQTKNLLLTSTQQKLQQTQEDVEKGFLTSIEYVAQVLDRWNATSEQLKNDVIANFRSKDILNPVYMMAFSGARGNISQVRQLTGMRGLMADPSGQIIDFPIESNFREGLTLTEYMISCYGARKGVVDTALRTATSGYLTRRLVDSAHHIIIKRNDCETTKGIILSTLQRTNKTILSLKSRFLGRVLAKSVYDLNNQMIASRNQEINKDLATRLADLKVPILLRSPMTCNGQRSVCQQCYGWSLAVNRLVTLSESVGIIAAQSIGEPGTQLTMRTFHTGGVFSSDVTDQVCAPSAGNIIFPKAVPGFCVRTAHGQIAFLTKEVTHFFLKATSTKEFEFKNNKNFQISLQPYSLLFVKQNQFVQHNQVLAEFAILQKMSQTVNATSTIYSTISGEIKLTNAQTLQINQNTILTVNKKIKQLKKNDDFKLKKSLVSKFQFFEENYKNFISFVSNRLNYKDFVIFVSNHLNYQNPKIQNPKSFIAFVSNYLNYEEFIDFVSNCFNYKYRKLLNNLKSSHPHPQNGDLILAPILNNDEPQPSFETLNTKTLKLKRNKTTLTDKIEKPLKKRTNESLNSVVKNKVSLIIEHYLNLKKFQGGEFQGGDLNIEKLLLPMPMLQTNSNSNLNNLTILPFQIINEAQWKAYFFINFYEETIKEINENNHKIIYSDFKMQPLEKPKIQNINVYPGEFWILAAQKQKLLNHNFQPMVEAGDWLQQKATLISSTKTRFNSEPHLLGPISSEKMCFGTTNTFRNLNSIFKPNSLQWLNYNLKLQTPLKTGSQRIISHNFFQWNNRKKKQKFLKKKVQLKSKVQSLKSQTLKSQTRKSQTLKSPGLAKSLKKQKSKHTVMSEQAQIQNRLKSFAHINLQWLLVNPIKFLKNFHKQKSQKKDLGLLQPKRNLIKSFSTLKKSVLNQKYKNKLNFMKKIKHFYSCTVYNGFLNKVNTQKHNISKFSHLKYWFIKLRTPEQKFSQWFLTPLENQYTINNITTDFNLTLQIIQAVPKKGLIDLKFRKTNLNLTKAFTKSISIPKKTSMEFIYNCNYSSFYISFLDATKHLILNYMWYSRLNLINQKQMKPYLKFQSQTTFFKHRFELNNSKKVIHSHVKILKNYRQTRVHNFPIDHKMVQHTNLKQIYWPFSKTHIQLLQPFTNNLKLKKNLLIQTKDLKLSKKKRKKSKLTKKLRLNKKSSKQLTFLVIKQKQLLNYLFDLQLTQEKTKTSKLINWDCFFVCHIILLNSTFNMLNYWILNLKTWQKLNRVVQFKTFLNKPLNGNSRVESKNIISNFVNSMLPLPSMVNKKFLTNDGKVKTKLSFVLTNLQKKGYKIKVVNSFLWLNSCLTKSFNLDYLKLTAFQLNLKTTQFQFQTSQNSVFFVKSYSFELKNVMTLKKSFLFKSIKQKKSNTSFTTKTYNYKQKNRFYNEVSMTKRMFEKLKLTPFCKTDLNLKTKKDLNTSNLYKNKFFNYWSAIKANKKIINHSNGFNIKTKLNLTKSKGVSQLQFIKNFKKLNAVLGYFNQTSFKSNKFNTSISNFGLMPYFLTLTNNHTLEKNTFSSVRLLRLQFLLMLKFKPIFSIYPINLLALEKLDNRKDCLKLKNKLKRKLNDVDKINEQKTQININETKKTFYEHKINQRKTKQQKISIDFTNANKLRVKRIKKKLNLKKLFKNNATLVKQDKLLLKKALHVSTAVTRRVFLHDINKDILENKDVGTNVNISRKTKLNQPLYTDVKLTQYYGWVYVINNISFNQKKLALMAMKTTGLFDNRLFIQRHFALFSNLTIYQSSYNDVWKTMIFPKFINPVLVNNISNRIEVGTVKPIFSAYISLFIKHYIEKNLLKCFSTLTKKNKGAFIELYSLALQFYSDVVYLQKSKSSIGLKINKKRGNLNVSTITKPNTELDFQKGFVKQFKNECANKLKCQFRVDKTPKIKNTVKKTGILTSQHPKTKLKITKVNKLKQLNSSTSLFNKGKSLVIAIKNLQDIKNLNQKKLKVLNLYYRLSFLKKAEMPLINYKIKFKTLPYLNADRILLLHTSKIYYNNSSRYKPALLLNKLCYKPDLKTKRYLKQDKRNLNIFFKINHILTVMQKPEEIYAQNFVSNQRYELQKQALNFKLKSVDVDKNIPFKDWLKPNVELQLKTHFHYTNLFKMHYYYYNFFPYNQVLERKSKPLKLTSVPQLKNYNKWFTKIESNKKNVYKSFWTRFRYNVILNKLIMKKQKLLSKGIKTLNSYNLKPFMVKQHRNMKQNFQIKKKLKNERCYEHEHPNFEETFVYFLRLNKFQLKMLSLQNKRKHQSKNLKTFKQSSPISISESFQPFKLNLNFVKKKFQLKMFLLNDLLTPFYCLSLLNLNKTNLTISLKTKPKKLIKHKTQFLNRVDVSIKRAKKTIKAQVLKIEKKIEKDSNVHSKLKRKSKLKKISNSKKTKKSKSVGVGINKDAKKHLVNGVETPNFLTYSSVLFKLKHHLRLQHNLFKPGFPVEIVYSQHKKFFNLLLPRQQKVTMLTHSLTKQRTKSENQGEILKSSTYWQPFYFNFWAQSQTKTINQLLLSNKKKATINVTSLNYNVKPMTEIITLTNSDLLSYRLNSQMHLNTSELSIGDFVSFATPCFSTHRFSESGQILEIRKTKLVLRRAKKFALGSGSNLELENNNFVNINAPLLKLNYKQIVNEDIIQGIPRIERLFEARSIKQGFTLAHLLQERFAHILFNYKYKKLEFRRFATIKAVEFIQHYTLDAIQSVYQSQGVMISDKHVEIIIKQMTSKVIIIEAGKTKFLKGDLIPYHMVLRNDLLQKFGVRYQPFILGITQTSLKADGFISAASFQETVNILTQATYFRKTDFLLGLKERVILGDLIPCGTALKPWI
uniref:DNA-directed RNA polymerase n=1 Tax=Blidingia minima TaxID=63414 RepID=A0A8E5J633_9CHLO|nr:DNA-directed RNA polymerase subunit beta [Blidingia minima]